MSFKGKVILITGASRGIGRAIALKLARAGAAIVVSGKSDSEGKLPGTIYSVADEVVAAGGEALAIRCDVRDENSVAELVNTTVEKFGRLDVLINNAGAIQLTPVELTPPKRMDLMLDINVRAVLVCSHYAIPHLKKSDNPHILSLSPPVSLKPHWLAGHTPYTISKFGMSLATMGMAEELKDAGIAVNSLWPRTLIGTEAVRMLLGDNGMEASRTPEIMADATFEILKTPSQQLTGQWIIDETILRERGVTDFSKYDATPGVEPALDLYIEE